MPTSEMKRAIPIDDFKITNLDSFKEVTKDPRQIASLYFYAELDCLVDLAYRISMDFFKRPHLYVNLEDLGPTLARLRAQLGSNERLPNKNQRMDIYQPVFGHREDSLKNDTESFPYLRDDLAQAAAAFAERVFDTGVEMLRERVRTTHRPFKEYLTGLQGESVRWSKEALLELTEGVCYKLFRNTGVAAVFGISKPPRASWPYDLDSNGDKLVEAISAQLMSDDGSKAYISRERISNLQRNALRGAEAIATIVEFDESKPANDADLNLLITKCYTWGSALMSVNGYHMKAGESPMDGKQPAKTMATAAFKR